MYKIINSETIQKRIEELEKKLKEEQDSYSPIPQIVGEYKNEIRLLQNILSNSKPLTPIIEDAFDESRRQHSWAGGHIYGVGEYGQEEEDLTDFKYVTKQDYIKQLKLDI